MRWASAISEARRLEDAIDEAADAVDAEMAGEAPDLVLVFTSTDHADHYSLLAPHVARRFPGAVVLGCSAGGVVGDAQEIEYEPGLALTAARLPGVDIKPFHLGPAADDWDAQLTGLPPDPIFLLIPDPFSVRAEAVVDWFDAGFPDAVTIGGLASGGTRPGESALFLGSELHRTGTVGVALTGNVEMETIVAQGCRPIGTPMFVTRAEGNVLYELDGQPAAQALESLYVSLSAEDQRLFQGSLFLGLVMDGQRQVYRHGDFLIRNLLGLDSQSGALLVGTRVPSNVVVQFHLRDADTSAADLEQLLGQRDRSRPAGAVLFSCLGRGRGLYGVPSHDSQLFRQLVGRVPIGGFFCNGEIGPVGDHTFLHGYTSSFGLFHPKK